MEEDPIDVRVGSGFVLRFNYAGLPPMAIARPDHIPDGVTVAQVHVATRRARFIRLSSLLEAGVITEQDLVRC